MRLIAFWTAFVIRPVEKLGLTFRTRTSNVLVLATSKILLTFITFQKVGALNSWGPIWPLFIYLFIRRSTYPISS